MVGLVLFFGGEGRGGMNIWNVFFFEGELKKQKEVNMQGK